MIINYYCTIIPYYFHLFTLDRLSRISHFIIIQQIKVNMIYSSKRQPHKNKNLMIKSNQILKELFYSQVRKLQSEHLLKQVVSTDIDIDTKEEIIHTEKKNKKNQNYYIGNKKNYNLKDSIREFLSFSRSASTQTDEGKKSLQKKYHNIESNNNNKRYLSSKDIKIVHNPQKIKKNQIKSFVKQRRQNDQILSKAKNKARQLHAQVKALQKVVHKQKQGLVLQRLKFIKQTEVVHKKISFLQMEQNQIYSKIEEILIKMQLKDIQKHQNYQKKNRKQIQIRNINYQFQCLSLNHQQKIEKLQKGLTIIKQNNSKLCKKIYNKKLQLANKLQKNKTVFEFNKKNKDILKKMIRKQEENNKLKLQKLILEEKQKQELKQQIWELIPQEKEQLFNRLDSVLNLIREHMKISANHREFKRIIKQNGMSYERDLRQLQNNQLTKQMMSLYEKQLWTAQLKTINIENIQNQPQHLASLKVIGKQLQLKKQELNEMMSRKDEQIQALQLKKLKISSQIERHSQDGKTDKDQQQSEI